MSVKRARGERIIPSTSGLLAATMIEIFSLLTCAVCGWLGRSRVGGGTAEPLSCWRGKLMDAAQPPGSR
jgi:hypothetical protein